MALFLTYALALLLPTLVYMLWRAWRMRRSADGGGGAMAASEPWRQAPWLALTLAGIAMLVLVILIGAFLHNPAPPARYVPPRLEDGRVVPGELRPEAGGAQRSGNSPSESR